MPDGPIATPEVQRALDAFLLNNPELEKLNAKLSEFNLFTVLRVENAEIRHSNVLAWLLNPQETHGLGALFLRRFLGDLLMSEQAAELPLSAARVALDAIGDVEVFRERHRIDILVCSRAQNWCLLVENKIRASESKDQLIRYLEAVQLDFEGTRVIPVFLTLDGEEPSEAALDAGYIPASHERVLQLLDELVEQDGARIPQDAAMFLNHYRTVLRRLTMQDDELVQLCKTIYQRHRMAIDLIVEHGTTSRIDSACEVAIAELTDCAWIQAAGGMVFFAPANLAQVMGEVELSGWKFLEHQVPVTCWMRFVRRTNKLRMCMEVGPIADPEARRRLLREVEKAGLGVRERAFREDSKYTRVESASSQLPLDEYGEPDESDEQIALVVAKLWKKLAPSVERMISALKNTDLSR